MKLEVYIWGLRVGFRPNEALYPNQADLTPDEGKRYAEIVTHFSDDKDGLFRLCDKDFYFLTKDSTYNLYSYVIANHLDYRARPAYLVFTICCPLNKRINGNIIEALNNIKKLYKAKNSDYSLTNNKFTKEQVEEKIINLQLNDFQSLNKKNQVIYFYEKETELNNLNELCGKEVYLIPEGSNEALVKALSAHEKVSLHDLIRKSSENETLKNRLTSLVNQKDEKDFAEANSIYQKIINQSDNNNNTISRFIDWKNARDKSININLSKSQFLAEIQYAIKTNYDYNPSKAKAILDSFPEVLIHFESNDKTTWNEWNSAYNNKSKNQFYLDLRALLDQAKQVGWTTDPAIFETEKRRFPSLPISADMQNTFEIWKKHFEENKDKNNEDAIIKQIDLLSKTIKDTRSREVKIEKQKDWESEVVEIEVMVSNMGKELKNENYLFLIKRTWKLQENNVWLKRALFSSVAIVTALGIYYFSQLEPVANKIDTDKDGVLDENDLEKNTPIALISNSTIRLKAFVDSNGVIAATKTEFLCSCFNIANKEDRKTLKCTDETSSFLLEGKIWKYNAEGNYFVDTSAVPIKNGDQFTKLDAYCKSKNFSGYPGGTPEPLVPPVPTGSVVRTFNGKKYTIEEKYVQENGSKVSSGAIYRFYNGKWEMKNSDSDRTWEKATEKNYETLWKKLKDPIIVIENPEAPKVPKVEETANADDEFWLKYMNGSTIKLNDMVRDCQAIKAKSGANSNPVTTAGIAAKKKVMSAVHNSAETNCQ